MFFLNRKKTEKYKMNELALFKHYKRKEHGVNQDVNKFTELMY